MSYQQTLLVIRKFLLTYLSLSFHLKRINNECKKIILEVTCTTLHKNKVKLHNNLWDLDHLQIDHWVSILQYNHLRFSNWSNWPLQLHFCQFCKHKLVTCIAPCRKASQYVFIVNILCVRIKALKIVDKIAFDSFFYDWSLKIVLFLCSVVHVT